MQEYPEKLTNSCRGTRLAISQTSRSNFGVVLGILGVLQDISKFVQRGKEKKKIRRYAVNKNNRGTVYILLTDYSHFLQAIELLVRKANGRQR
jgi:hypothetical protein